MLGQRQLSSINVKKLVRDLLKGTKATTGYYGLPDLVANTDSIISEIYSADGYTATELAALAAWYAGRVTFPVLAEYPRTVQDLPAVFVFRQGDSEIERGIVGEFVGTDEDEDTDFTATEIYGSIFSEQISIHIWATGDGAMRDDLYIAVRELIMRAVSYFASADVMFEWKAGKDGQLYEESERPRIIHQAQATLSCTSSIQWTSTGEKVLDIQSRAKAPDSLRGEVTADPFESVS